jgi:RsiW-degrading membrane proteinase PrsW (M82 family)
VVASIGLSVASAVAIVAGAGLLWLLYFDFKDTIQKEPRHLLAASVALGGGSALLAMGAFVLAERLGLPRVPGDSTREIFAYCVLALGPIEEGAKFLVARTIIFRWHAFDEKIDGLIYSAALGIGFAAVENFFYWPHLGTVERLARAITSPLTHALFASIWGFGVSQALFTERPPLARFLWQALPLLLAMALHGLYDALLLAWGATVPASATILAIWIFVLWQGHRLVRQPSA